MCIGNQTTEIEKSCRRCSETFLTDRATKVYCTTRCGDMWIEAARRRRRTQDRPRICVQCGEEFTKAHGGKVKYCSPQCRKAAFASQPQARVCPCGNQFMWRGGYHKYCSNECRVSKYKKARIKGVCSLCSEEFLGPANKKFCSRICGSRYSSWQQQGMVPKEAYDALRGNDGACDACGLGLAPHRVAVDHCHTTGRVRGVIHQRCNAAIGLLDDDPDRIRALADYLLKV